LGYRSVCRILIELDASFAAKMHQLRLKQFIQETVGVRDAHKMALSPLPVG
jgi:hypothetical protein